MIYNLFTIGKLYPPGFDQHKTDDGRPPWKMVAWETIRRKFGQCFGASSWWETQAVQEGYLVPLNLIHATIDYSWILLRGFLPMENLRSSIGEKKGDMHRGDALLPVYNCKIVSIKYMLNFFVLLNMCFLLVPKINLCSDFLPKTTLI